MRRMKNKIRLSAILLFAAAVLTFACAPADKNGSAPDPNGKAVQSAEKQIYKSAGTIKAIDANAGKITIDHEDIPGYMSAMEMTETVADQSLLSQMKAGDKVEFEIERTEAKVVFTKLKKIGEIALLNSGEIYRTNCAECHGARGEGAKKGISLVKGHALAHSEAEHIAQVTNGEGKKMPAFRDELTTEEIVAVVKFVREELQKGATPEQRKSHHH